MEAEHRPRLHDPHRRGPELPRTQRLDIRPAWSYRPQDAPQDLPAFGPRGDAKSSRQRVALCILMFARISLHPALSWEVGHSTAALAHDINSREQTSHSSLAVMPDLGRS